MNGTRQAVTLRPAAPEDCRRIWEWRNEAQTREASFTTDPVPYDSHVRWYEKTLADPARRLLVVCSGGGEPIGYVRLDAGAEGATINISMDASLRGKGYGTSAIGRAADFALQSMGAGKVIALIKHANAASQAAFRKAGFVPDAVPAEAGYLRMVFPGGAA